jgi:hypothetical protein
MTPRFKLRTLLIVLALGPPVLAGAFYLAVQFAYSVLANGYD